VTASHTIGDGEHLGDETSERIGIDRPAADLKPLPILIRCGFGVSPTR